VTIDRDIAVGAEMVARLHWLAILGLLGALQCASALNNGLAQKPPLAYSNWNIVGPKGTLKVFPLV